LVFPSDFYQIFQKLDSWLGHSIAIYEYHFTE
jgi:hypothetical protein